MERDKDSSRVSTDEQYTMHSSFLSNSYRHLKLRSIRSKSSILSTRDHRIDLFGPQLPVFVAENLAYIPGAKTNASVQLNPVSGWAWYICGRKLLVWQLFKEDGFPKQIVSCRELLLPFSDLAITGNHVSVFVQPENKTASCIAVTPEGLVRYWEVVSQHAPWADVNTNLGGEEVCAVHHIPPHGTLAVTTSATMLLITPSKTRSGMFTVNTQHISSRSWFSGISKKMNSIIFGSVSNVQGTESRLVKVLTKHKGDDEWCIYLLAGMKLQCWLFKEVKKFILIYEHDLEPMIRKAIFEKDILTNPQSNGVEILISDINLVEGGIMILAVTVEPRSYVLLHFPCEDNSAPADGFKSCDLTSKDIMALEEVPGKITHLQFLLLPADALFFNNKLIVAVPMGSEQVDGDRLEIPGGKVKGHNIYNNNPIFFSGTYGFVTISPLDTASFDLLNRSTADTTPKIIAAKEPRVLTKPDRVANIKSAFLLYLRKNTVQCRQIIEKEFPNSNGGLNNPLATTLVKVSRDIIHNIPPKDPRWETGSSYAIPTITSLHVETQLSEKQSAHDLFLKFVYDLSLHENLGQITRNGKPVDAIHILNEHNEKILATSILRKLQEPYKTMIVEAINMTISSMKLSSSLHLSNQDFFYRYVSLADKGIKALIKKSREIANESKSYFDVYGWIEAANEVVAEVVYAVIEKREKTNQPIDANYPTWLSSSGKSGIFDSLIILMNLTYEFLESTDEDDEEYKRISYLLFRLADIILYLQKNYSSHKVFRKATSNMISCFMKDDLFVLAKQLAHKYRAFTELIEVTYMLQEESSIPSYIEELGDEGFCEELFRWYVKNNRKKELLFLELPERFSHKLGNFLRRYKKLLWLYKLKEIKMVEGCNELSKLALAYKKDAIIKERMLSLAKLTNLTLDEVIDNYDDLLVSLECINIQRSIPESIIALRGTGSIPYLDPHEIIELLICEENTGADENHFKTALEVLKFIKEDELRDKLQHSIWIKAIYRDSWTNIDHTKPSENFNDIFFYRLMDLVCSDTDTISLVLPMESLLEDDELQPIRNNIPLKYILRYTYSTVYDDKKKIDLN